MRPEFATHPAPAWPLRTETRGKNSWHDRTGPSNNPIVDRTFEISCYSNSGSLSSSAFRSHEAMSQESNVSQQAHVVEMIESMIRSMLEELTKPNGKLVIELKSQSTARRDRFFNHETDALEVQTREECRVLSYPGNSDHEVLRFSMRTHGLHRIFALSDTKPSSFEF